MLSVSAASGVSPGSSVSTAGGGGGAGVGDALAIATPPPMAPAASAVVKAAKICVRLNNCRSLSHTSADLAAGPTVPLSPCGMAERS